MWTVGDGCPLVPSDYHNRQRQSLADPFGFWKPAARWERSVKRATDPKAADRRASRRVILFAFICSNCLVYSAGTKVNEDSHCADELGLWIIYLFILTRHRKLSAVMYRLLPSVSNPQLLVRPAVMIRPSSFPSGVKHVNAAWTTTKDGAIGGDR